MNAWCRAVLLGAVSLGLGLVSKGAGFGGFIRKG